MSWFSGYIPALTGPNPAPPYTFVRQGLSSSQVAQSVASAQHTIAADVIVFGPYGTQDEAQARLADAHVGGEGSPSYQSQLGQTIQNNIPGASALSGIAGFASDLTNKNVWIRVGEFLAGGIILYVGLKAVATPAGQKVSHQTVHKTLRRMADVTPAGRTVNAARRK